MKRIAMLAGMVLMIGPVTGRAAKAQEVTLETTPPVVVKTVPEAGSAAVDPATKEIRVTFSKPMTDRSWSVVQMSRESYPAANGQPHYEKDGRSWVFPVNLQPGRVYALWLNTDRFTNFKDRDGQPALPYLLVFQTAKR